MSWEFEYFNGLRDPREDYEPAPEPAFPSDLYAEWMFSQQEGR